LREKITHFDHKRIQERIAHASGLRRSLFQGDQFNSPPDESVFPRGESQEMSNPEGESNIKALKQYMKLQQLAVAI
jgi:hypothetical protein